MMTNDADHGGCCGFIYEVYKSLIKRQVCEMANLLLDYLDLTH